MASRSGGGEGKEAWINCPCSLSMSSLAALVSWIWSNLPSTRQKNRSIRIHGATWNSYEQIALCKYTFAIEHAPHPTPLKPEELASGQNSPYRQSSTGRTGNRCDTKCDTVSRHGNTPNRGQYSCTYCIRRPVVHWLEIIGQSPADHRSTGQWHFVLYLALRLNSCDYHCLLCAPIN